MIKFIINYLGLNYEKDFHFNIDFKSEKLFKILS